MQSASTDVFIAHHHQPMIGSPREDTLANLVAEHLTDLGLEVWHDAMLRVGEDFAQSIHNQLAAAGVLVALWTRRSAESDWFKAELDMYRHTKKPLIHCLMDRDMHLPPPFNRDPAFDLSEWRGEISEQWICFLKMLSGCLGYFSTPRFDLALVAERNAHREKAPQRPQTPAMRLFVSHASQSDGPKALALVRRIEAGIHRCVVAPRDVQTGISFSDWIRNSIRDSSAMVVLISSAALRSEYVKDEVHHAISMNRPVLPVRVEPIDDYGSIHVRLPRLHRVDWLTNDIEPTVQALEAALIAA